MSKKLIKPFNKKQRLDFIVEYNHNQGLMIQETSKAIYALEPNEILDENDDVIINPDYEKMVKLQEKEQDTQNIIQKLNELDAKRIRAVCENSVKDELTGLTWLEFYNNQVEILRKKLQDLT